MEAILVLTAIVSALVILDIASIRFGTDSRFEGTNGSTRSAI